MAYTRKNKTGKGRRRHATRAGTRARKQTKHTTTRRSRANKRFQQRGG
jgi:hypothetical protein